MTSIGLQKIPTEGISIRFEGRLAESQPMNARDLGEFLVGIEWIASTGLYLAEHGKYPASRSKRNYSIRVEEFRPGESFWGLLFVEYVGTTWPLFSEATATGFVHFFWEALLARVAGTSKEVHEHSLMKAYDILHDVTQQRHDEMMKMMELFDDKFHLFDKAARQTIRSIGPYCDIIDVQGPYGAFAVDRNFAEAIRARLDQTEAKTQTQEATLYVKLYGLNRRRRQAEVEVYGEPGRFIQAYVDDPTFDGVRNMYTIAFSEGWDLRAEAEIGLLGDRIRSIRIKSAQIVNRSQQ